MITQLQSTPKKSNTERTKYTVNTNFRWSISYNIVSLWKRWLSSWFSIDSTISSIKSSLSGNIVFRTYWANLYLYSYRFLTESHSPYYRVPHPHSNLFDSTEKCSQKHHLANPLDRKSDNLHTTPAFQVAV